MGHRVAAHSDYDWLLPLDLRHSASGALEFMRLHDANNIFHPEGNSEPSTVRCHHHQGNNPRVHVQEHSELSGLLFVDQYYLLGPCGELAKRLLEFHMETVSGEGGGGPHSHSHRCFHCSIPVGVVGVYFESFAGACLPSAGFSGGRR
eukprot:symbB.v1.2.030285.t1/scaffold3273.1/size59893/5